MPFSYAQYAGNGSTTTFSVPFPYLLKAHVKLYTGFNILTGAYTSLLVDGTDYTWTSTTQVQTTVAPANGVTLTVLRDTPDSTQLVPWQDGSNLVADDMNIADLQNLYVVQEQQDRNDAGITQSTAAAAAATAATTAANTATSTANTALSTANAATSTANTALSTANTASSNASAAVSTANTASSNASAAVTTANAANATAGTASTNASNAVTTANAAAANAATALSTANTAATNASAAVSTANTASSNAAAAVSTANTANTNASNAVTTANTASTNASAAVSTANAASTAATSATTTANTANNKADQAIAAVSNSVNYQLKANVAAIPASPANDTYIEVQDSTGLESFTPLAGKPAGFVGDAGLSVRLRYTTAGATWNWLNYYANDSDARFLKKTGGTMTGPIVLSGAPTTGLNPATKTYVDGYVSSLQGDIGTVSTAAAGAQSTANTAVANAATAQTTANTAVSNAATAQSAANAAQTTANTAVSNAAAAQSTANTAVTNAAAAQATADAALPKAGGTATGNISAPAFIPTGGTAPTNGVYLPAANSVAISTSGAGRVFVGSTGNIGIGAASAGARLLVQESASSALVNSDADGIVVENNGNTGITLGSSTTGNGSIRFADSGSANAGLIFYDHTNNYLRIDTNDSERLRIDSSGRVGIGTSSPSELLTLNSSGTTGTAVRLENTSAGGYNWGIYSVGSAASLGPVGSLAFRDSTNGSTRFVIDSSGRVGIGTTSPVSTLHVNSGATGTVAKLESSGSGSYLNFVNSSGSSVYVGAIATNFFVETNGSERARIDSSGRLLVGTSSGDTAGLILRNYQYQGTNYMRPLGYYGADLGMVDNTNTRVWAAITSQYNQGSAVSAGLFLSASHVDTGGSACGYTIKHNKSDHSLAFSYVTTGASIGSPANETERMRLASSGFAKFTNDSSYSGIDTDSHGFRQGAAGNWVLECVNAASSGNIYGIHSQFVGQTPNNTNNFFYLGSDPTNNKFIVYSNGGIANYSGNNVNLSDEREKKNIEDLESTWDCLKHWELKKFHYNEDADTEAKRYGVIAQQVEEHCPEVISEWVKQKAKPAQLDDDGNELEPAKEEVVRMGVKEQQMYWMAIKALQEAQVRIEALEAEVAALKAG